MKTQPTPADVANKLITLDEIAREMEAKWGVGRLIRLVSEDTRAAFRRGWTAWHDAQATGDRAKLMELIPKLAQAWRAMAAQATRLGCQPLTPDVMEARAADGRVVVVVRTNAEAHAVVREGRQVIVWTIQEIANVLPRLELLDTIKREFPGALVDRAVQLAPGYAESWATQASGHEVWHERDEDLMGLSPAPIVEEVG